MRVLMLTDFYPPIVGGVEQHVRNLSLALLERGHEVAVVTLWHEGAKEFDLDSGIRVYRVKGTVQRAARLFSDAQRRYSPPIPDPEVVLALRDIVKRERPQVVHGHSWLVQSFLPLKAWSKAKLVVTLHEYSLACPKKTLVYKGSQCSGPGFTKCLGCASEHYGVLKGVPTVFSNWITGRIERSAVDMFLPVSHAVAAGSGLEGKGRRKDAYEVIPNFVAADISSVRSPSNPLLNELPSEPYLLFVGALGQHKGVNVLLRAYELLVNPPPLVLIGAQWPDSPTEFPPNVTVLHSWPHDAVMEAWRRCVIGLVPSVWPEPSGTVLIEAMAVGRPVIASRVGGMVDIVEDGKTGLLVAPNDARALAEAMRTLLAQPELRERLGEAGAREANLFKADVVVPQIEAVYRKLVMGVSVGSATDPDSRDASAYSVREPSVHQVSGER